MPQIAQIGEIYSSQLFWLAITFGLIFFGIGLGMVPKIQSTVDARDARIAADLAEAEKARETADSLEEEYRQALERARSESSKAVSEAKAEAGRISERKLAEAGTAIDARVEEAQKRIDSARAEAMKELQAVAAEATRELVEKLAGLRVDQDLAAKAVSKEFANG